MLNPGDIQVIPVLELEPSVFATQVRELPAGSSRDLPDEWSRYWTDALADSGIVELRALRRGSWHVPTPDIDPDNLRKVLAGLIAEWGGVEALSAPDEVPMLRGGFALHCPTDGAVIEPGCCADLGGLEGWREAAAHRGAEWRMLWNGHPWLMVRYAAPSLVVSNEDELEDPARHFAFTPAALIRAIDEAGGELERFVVQLAHAITTLGYRGDALALSRKLAGLR